ncbi:RNA-directed DNA polymerase from mobile element jockey [Trichonephila clavipes]|nr:RNA-directed DNA polymerase from mobile element jockey [Trichonephila clavipes]
MESDSGRLLIWREQRTRYHQSNTVERHSYRGGGILVWAGISLGGHTDLHVFHGGTVTGLRYRDEILDPYVRPYAAAIGNDFILMDDNARPHRARIVQEYLEDHGLERMEWPARSPDLNPIEHLWDYLGREVAALNPPPRSLHELKQSLLCVWSSLPIPVSDNLINSMGNRCRQCIQQCGFRPKCSTVHKLLRVTELIHSGFAKHEATGVLFLDIAKAFDKIWHDGLLFKLIRLDFPPPLIKSIHSFLSHRSFRVRVDKTLSSPRPIRSGLPQGSLSSPLLFTLYVNDMPQTDLSHLAMFADDTAIITQNKRFSVVISNLQHYISLLELWLTDRKVKVNASKSACLRFASRPRLPVGLTPVQIFGQPVPWVRVAKYLGLFLDAKLTFAHHIEQTRKKAQAVHAVLKRLISRRSKLAIRHKEKLNLSTSIIKNPEHLSTNCFNFKFALKKKPLPTVELTSNDNIELAISELNQNFIEAFVEASKPKFNNAPKILSPEIKFKIHQRTGYGIFGKELGALVFILNSVPSVIRHKVIADSLQEQFESNHVAGREEFDQRIHAEVENFLTTPHVQEIEPTTPTEILTYVQRIKPKNSPDLIKFQIV